MIQARFSPRAERDLDEICDDIAADNPAAAERVRRLILNMRQYYFELASSVNWELLSPINPRDLRTTSDTTPVRVAAPGTSSFTSQSVESRLD